MFAPDLTEGRLNCAGSRGGEFKSLHTESVLLVQGKSLDLDESCAVTCSTRSMGRCARTCINIFSSLAPKFTFIIYFEHENYIFLELCFQ